MGYKVKFDTGHTVQFDHEPSQDDIEEAFSHVQKIPIQLKVEDMKAPTYMGIPEAALSMVSGIPSQIAGGLYGLGTLASGQGLDKAADAAKRIQESNFGFGSYQGTTEPGKRATQKAGELLAAPGEAAGEYIGAPIGRAFGNEELGRLSAKLPTDVAMNFLPLHLGVTAPLRGISKATSALEARNTPVPSTKLDALKALQTPEQPVGPSLMAGKEMPAPIDREFMAQHAAEEAARAHQENMSRIDALMQQRQLELEQEVKRNVGKAKADTINDANLKALQEERDNAQSLFENEQQAKAAEAQRQLLSTGENAPGEGKSPVRAMATEDSGVMGLPEGPVEPPVGLSTGEAGVGTGPSPQRPQGPSNLMGVEASPVVPERPIGLSTGEGMPGNGRGVSRPQTVGSGLEGIPTSPAYDPFGSIAGRQRKRGQSGAIDAEFFKTGFKNVNKALSRLTDQPWVRQAFPSTKFEANRDGTPKVLLHGTREAFNDQPRGVSYEGLHAGYGGAATLKAATNSKEGRVGYRESNLSYNYNRTKDNNSAMYPVVLKKGNYPRLDGDYGSWEPLKLTESRQFKLDLAKVTEHSYFEIDDILHNFQESLKTKNLSAAEENTLFSKLLKDHFDIDGFFYPNTYETAKNNLRSRAGLTKNPQRARNLAEKLGLEDSVVTYDDSNMVSLFDNKRGQRGGVDINSIIEEAKKIGTSLSKLGSSKVSGLSKPEELVSKNLGESYVPKGDAPQSIIQNALAEGKDAPSVFKNWQSGLGQYGTKVQSTLASGVARWLSWGEKEGTKAFREKVQPVEKELGSLSHEDLKDAWDVLKEEMFSRQQFTEEQMKAAGYSEEAIHARGVIREAQETALKELNSSRAKLDMKPITPEAAYLSSMWQGNWHIPIYDKQGKLVWYVKTESKGEAKKAVKWVGENHGDSIDVSKLVPEFKPNEISKLPKDVTDVYSQMMEVFKDSPIGKQMEQLMADYKTEQGFKKNGFQVHFESKGNIRGFLGDRPWLSEKENTLQGMKAQINYLKQAHSWAPMQEAIANIKEVLSNEELQAQQPNNMAMAKAYTAQSLGLVDNLFKGAENAVAKAFGSSPGKLGQWTGGLKSLTYLQQLGASVGYSIATPVQAFILGPSKHMLLSESGVKHNPIKTMMYASADTARVLLAHAMDQTSRPTEAGLSAFGKDARKYMEDNNIITVNLFDEYANLGEGKVASTAKTYLGYTISMPEKVARVSTFMSFAHHLNDGGFQGTKLELFRKAEELTNDTLTNMNRSARPLAVGKAGLMGELAYTYKSPMINYYNNLSTLARRGLETKNPMPFIMAAVAMPALLGGMMDVPLVQELDGGISLLKKAVAKWYPQHYAHLEGFGIKEALLRSGSDVATYGVVSKATGAQMASRFSNQIADPQDPLGGIAPVATELREQASLLKAGAPLLNGELPNSTGLTEAAWQNAPPMVKGALENYDPRFQTGPERADGTQGVFNPHKMNEKLYDRTKADRVYRNLGLTSLSEARTRDVRYLNNTESSNLNTARVSSIEHLHDALIRGNQGQVTKYAKSYFDNYGDSQKFDADFNKAIEGQHISPEERQVMKANTLAEIMNVKRRLDMENKRAN
jgi:hypothetical protein